MIRAALLACAFLFTGAAFAQYPAKPIRITIPFGAGGPSDLHGRLLAEHMSQILGQSVIVENRAGGGGVLAHRYVMQQPPDGYNFVLSGDYVTLYPSTVAAWDMDLLKDFTPAGTFAATMGALLLTSAQAPFNTMDELLNYAKANPGKVNWAGVGTGTFTLTLRYAEKVYGLKMVEVPYKSSADAKVATLRGDLSIYPDTTAGANDKSLKPLLLINSALRLPQNPQVQNLRDGQIGKLGLTFSNYSGLLGPANVPADIAAKISSTLDTVVKNRDFSTRLEPMGFLPRYSTGAEYRTLMANDLATVGKLAKELGLVRQ